MSTLRPAKRALAILWSDIHISSECPPARKAEPDWYVAQGRYLDEVYQLQQDNQCPSIIAGDITNIWNETPECIAFVFRRLVKSYAIPGNHCLPYHRYEARGRAVYGALCAGGKIRDLPMRTALPVESNGIKLQLYGTPYGFEPHPVALPEEGEGLKIAVVHKFIWTKATGYSGAPEDGRLGKIKEKLKGYNVAVVGDNHRGFLHDPKDGNCIILNSGCTIPRRSDERDLRPSVGLLKQDGTVERYYLDTSKDKWADPEDVAKDVAKALDLGRFTKAMNELTNNPLDFREAVLRHIRSNKDDMPEEVRCNLLAFMEPKKK